MARVLATSTAIPSPKTLKLTEVTTPMRYYPSHLYREQFWYRGDGATITPNIDHLQPSTAKAGGSDMRLYVHGSSFTAESKIVFNDVEEPTTMESANILSTGVRAGMFAVPADVEVKVTTGAEESNILIFKFT